MRTMAICLVALLWPVLGFSDQRDGAVLYKSICANCHGNDGNSTTAADKKMSIPDLRAEAVQSRSDDALFASIGRGVGLKEYPHVFLSRGMTEKDIRDLIVHIRTFRKK